MTLIRSRNQFFDHLPVNVGEPEVSAGITIRERLVVEAKEVQDGRVEVVVVDPRLIWPYTIAIGTDKYLYITTSQNDLRAEFHNGKDLRLKPYGVYRIFIGSGPVHAMER